MTSAPEPQAAPHLRWLRRATQGIPPNRPRPPRPASAKAPSDGLARMGRLPPAARTLLAQSPPPRAGLRRTGRAGRRARQTRLGVLSGTFNPPTRAHLALATQGMRQLSLDEVLFVIPELPPHKQQLEASLEQRAEMLLRATAEEPRFSVAVSSHGLFLDIWRALRPHYPAGTKVLFLAGRDAAERILLRWPYPDPRKALAEMFAAFDFGVAERSGRLNLPDGSPAAPYGTQIHSFKIDPECEAISASLVRDRLARGESIKELVPTEVEAFLRERALYAAGRG